MKIKRIGEHGLGFFCPGCKELHQIQNGSEKGPNWDWNTSFEKPTFHPSILCTWTEGLERIEKRCHSFVCDGNIQFLTDCTHELAGQTVPLSDIEA